MPHPACTPADHPAIGRRVLLQAGGIGLLGTGLADLLRQRIGRDAVSLPLARILEGGTWAAGRAMAFERRPDGSPPVKVVSDGTVF